LHHTIYLKNRNSGRCPSNHPSIPDLIHCNQDKGYLVEVHLFPNNNLSMSISNPQKLVFYGKYRGRAPYYSPWMGGMGRGDENRATPTPKNTEFHHL
jgi:hypothetical protein